MGVDIPVGLQLLFGHVSYAAVEENCTSGLVVVFYDSNKVAYKAACQTLSKAFLKSMKTG